MNYGVSEVGDQLNINLQTSKSREGLTYLVVMLGLLFLFFLPFRNSFVVIDPASVTIARLLGAVFGVLWLFKIVVFKEQILIHRFHLLFIVFVGWTLSSTLWATDPALSISHSFRLITVALMLVAIWDTFLKIRSPTIGLQILVAGLYVMVLSTTYEFLTTDGVIRAAGLGYNPNELGTTVMIGIPIAYYLAINPILDRTALKVLNGLYIPLGLLTVFATGSRGSAIAVTVVTVALVVTTVYMYDIRRVAIVGLLVLVGLVPFRTHLLPEPAINRIRNIPTMLLEGAAGNRTEIWLAGLELVQLNPVLGVGANNFSVHVGWTAHSTFLNVQAELGLLGSTIFILLVGLAVRYLTLYKDDCNLLLIFLIGWMTAAVFNTLDFITIFITLVLIMAEYSSNTTIRE